jgi:arabinofuranan 3-O-arabinosyltransferase
MSAQVDAASAHSRASGNPDGAFRQGNETTGSPLSRGRADAGNVSATRLVSLIGLTLALGYLIVLGGSYLNGHFLADAQGQPIANDFVNVFAAGRLALSGDPAAAYDWTLHEAAEVRAVGHTFANYYGWHYPPTFLFVAAALAMLPFLAAAVTWLAATLAAYAATLYGILGGRAGIFLALGFPAALWNATAGQNGFLTAALIGGTLGLLERRPALAGVCLGLLTYKPQFGFLFPIVLIADRRWLTLTVAAVVAAALAALSWLAFGSATWLAFAHWMPVTGRVVLAEGAVGWSRLQSLFALVRAEGGSEALAFTVQAIAVIALAAGLVWLWRSRAAYELKAAALTAGALLATPYVFMYDLVVLAVAVAFLLRLALKRGFTASEILGLPCAGMLILVYPFVNIQVGLAATLIVMLLVVQRALAELHPLVPAKAGTQRKLR